MKVAVHGRSLAGDRSRRMRQAAAGLALRGHRVTWLGPGAPREQVDSGVVSHVADRHGRLKGAADLILGGARMPLRVAVNGWLAGASGMVLALETEASPPGPLGRWAWDSLDAVGLAEASHTPEGVARMLDPERVERWSDQAPPEAPDPAHPDTEILERLCERRLARRRGQARGGAAFLDRDGTLVVERGYLAWPEDLELLPLTVSGLRRLQALGFALVVISNQSGVGRGLFPIERVHQAMARLRVLLRDHGIELEAVYFCPHRPDAGCDCRKPGTALLRQAATNLGIALERSVMIGDKLLDVETGHRARALSVLVRTGYGRDEELRVSQASAEETPDFVGEDLAAAAAWIGSQGEPRDTAF